MFKFCYIQYHTDLHGEKILCTFCYTTNTVEFNKLYYNFSLLKKLSTYMTSEIEVEENTGAYVDKLIVIQSESST